MNNRNEINQSVLLLMIYTAGRNSNRVQIPQILSADNEPSQRNRPVPETTTMTIFCGRDTIAQKHVCVEYYDWHQRPACCWEVLIVPSTLINLCCGCCLSPTTAKLIELHLQIASHNHSITSTLKDSSYIQQVGDGRAESPPKTELIFSVGII